MAGSEGEPQSKRGWLLWKLANFWKPEVYGSNCHEGDRKCPQGLFREDEAVIRHHLKWWWEWGRAWEHKIPRDPMGMHHSQGSMVDVLEPWWHSMFGFHMQHQYPICALILVLAVPLDCSLLTAWKISRGNPKCLGLCTHVEDSEETPGSWFWMGPVVAVAAISEMNQWREQTFIFSLSLLSV